MHHLSCGPEGLLFARRLKAVGLAGPRELEAVGGDQQVGHQRHRTGHLRAIVKADSANQVTSRKAWITTLVSHSAADGTPL